MAIVFDNEQTAAKPRILFDNEPKRGVFGQGWDALTIPEKTSRKGLQILASFVPEGKATGNLAADVVRGTPKVIADTMAETAPGFVSRGAILSAGAGPALKLAGRAAAPLGKAVAAGLEDWSGIAGRSGQGSGALVEAAKDPSLIFSKGTKAAKQFYEAAKRELPYEQTLFKGLTSPQEIVDKAVAVIDKGGKLEAQEGLTARKALDQIRKRVSGDAFAYYRKIFDGIAKSDEYIATADPTFKRGLMAESLRSIFPKNIGGRASPFKVGEAMAISHLGPLGKFLSLGFSPLALGSAATGLGVAGRAATNPAAAVTASQVLRRMRNRPS